MGLKYFINEYGEYICNDVDSEYYGRNIYIHKRIGRICSLILIGMLLLSFFKIDSRGYIPINIKKPIPKFSKENLLKEINNINPTYSSLCISQCQLESGMGTSTIYKQTNNLFGLCVYSLSERHLNVLCSDGKIRPFKIYDNWMESLQDWYKLVVSKQNEAQIAYMKQYYCTDVNYCEQLKQLVKNEKGDIQK